MKKIIIIVAILLLVAVLVPGITLFVTFKDNSAIQDGKVLNNFATVIKDGFVSCYMFETGKGEVGFIDACTDQEGKAVLSALKKRGLGPDAVRTVFLTHGDSDHTAACPLFKKAKIYCMEADVALAEGKEKPKKPIAVIFPLEPMDFKVTDILKDGETVRAGNVEVQVFSVPGHSKGSAVFLAGGVLFMGDGANAAGNGTLMGSNYIFSESQPQNVASLKTLALRLKSMSNKIKILAPSHTGSLIRLQPLLDFTEKH
jgi:hydroxyacylglutathione hydrolase